MKLQKNISLSIYKFCIKILNCCWRPFYKRSCKKRGNLEEFYERFGFINFEGLSGTKKETLWMHASSIGEIKIINIFMNFINRSDFNILVTTSTSSGKDVAKSLIKPDFFVYITL